MLGRKKIGWLLLNNSSKFQILDVLSLGQLFPNVVMDMFIFHHEGAAI